MLMHLCKQCKKPILIITKYCDTCYKQYTAIDAESKTIQARNYNRTRDKKYTTFYKSEEWQTIRGIALAKAGFICQECKQRLAEDVHHKIPLKQDWDKRLDISNLMAVCVSCHNVLDKRC